MKTLVLLAALTAAAPGPEVVTAWNEEAYEIAYAEDKFLTFKGQRAMALMHLAMHDALNAIDRKYQPYAYTRRHEGRVPVAVAAQAAHDVLLALYPDQRKRLDAELKQWSAGDPAQWSAGDPAREAREAGSSAASHILSMRADDGWDQAGTYEFRSSAGSYQTTPDWKGFTLQPGFRFARPLALERPEQFRPPPPPALDGGEYARALREVKDMPRGKAEGAYAIWWMEFAEGSVNRLARALAAERRMNLWDAARMFALLNTSLYDSYIAVWDSKYEYNHWRPYTAIRATVDAKWDSMLPAPPFPEYVSAHAAGCAATFAVLEKSFGGNVAFTMKTITAPPGMPSRRFESFRAAAEECADSRIRLGWHFRYATDAGLALGRTVARHIEERHLRPVGNNRRARQVREGP